jgi:hypothetical protein
MFDFAARIALMAVIAKFGYGARKMDGETVSLYSV